VSQIELAPEVADDFERILEHLLQHEVAHAEVRVDELIKAISVLESNPLIGRLAGDGLRELVIGRQSRGYVACYRYVQAIDTVFVLAVRSQREAGYREI